MKRNQIDVVTPDSSFSERFRYIRTHYFKCRQDEYAKIFDLPRTTIVRYENGGYPNASTVPILVTSLENEIPNFNASFLFGKSLELSTDIKNLISELGLSEDAVKCLKKIRAIDRRGTLLSTKQGDKSFSYTMNIVNRIIESEEFLEIVKQIDKLQVLKNELNEVNNKYNTYYNVQNLSNKIFAQILEIEPKIDKT